MGGIVEQEKNVVGSTGDEYEYEYERECECEGECKRVQ